LSFDMSYSDFYLKKLKYFEKTLSNDAIYSTYLRTLDVAPLLASYAWLILPWIDLAQLGLGLLYDFDPMNLVPFSLDFEAKLPTVEETLQGIWMKFERIRYEELYEWTTSIEEFVTSSFKPEHAEGILSSRIRAAVYGVTQYGYSAFDPLPSREAVRTTLLRLRLLRPSDPSYRMAAEELIEQAECTEAIDEHVLDRLMIISSAQRNAFVLGLGVLGMSRLTRVEDGWGVVPVIDHEGNPADLRFTTLDQLQLGFLLGMTPLGYGYLLPKESAYLQPEGKGDPIFLEATIRKAKKVVSAATTFTWSYSNYNKPEEMEDWHKSQRTAQYDLLMTQRAVIEDWVEKRIPPEEANPVRARQYKNAVLQAIAWRAKRHKWGYDAWKAMTEDQFKEWWKRNWTRQGLSEPVLDRLYEEMRVWVRRIQREKLDIGEKVRRTRLSLALTS